MPLCVSFLALIDDDAYAPFCSQARRGSEGQASESQLRQQKTGIARALERLFEFGHERESIPLTSLRNPRPESIAAQDLYQFNEVDQHLCVS